MFLVKKISTILVTAPCVPQQESRNSAKWSHKSRSGMELRAMAGRFESFMSCCGSVEEFKEEKRKGKHKDRIKIKHKVLRAGLCSHPRRK